MVIHLGVCLREAGIGSGFEPHCAPVTILSGLSTRFAAEGCAFAVEAKQNHEKSRILVRIEKIDPHDSAENSRLEIQLSYSFVFKSESASFGFKSSCDSSRIRR